MRDWNLEAIRSVVRPNLESARVLSTVRPIFGKNCRSRMPSFFEVGVLKRPISMGNRRGDLYGVGRQHQFVSVQGNLMDSFKEKKKKK